MNVETFCQPDHNHQARIAATPFNAPQVRHIDFGVYSEFFLAQAASLPELKNIAANYGPPVHRETERDNDYSHQGL